MISMKTYTSKMYIAVYLIVAMALSVSAAASKVAVTPEQPIKLFPLRDVRLLESPFSEAVKANHQYLLAHDPDRLLAPFRREAGLAPRAQPYGNWESIGLDGHSAGHYLSALSLMMASGADPTGEFRRRLDYMIGELVDVQKANSNGYIGGIPGSRDYWNRVAAGHVELMRNRWAPWYNLHKMFAGLRDAYLHGGNEKARDLLVRYGDWCEKVTSGLTDAQMQRMLDTEYGGMNEVLADIYAITGNKKYIELAKHFNHRAIFEPLENHQDRLTGLHANTQIPKITGMERIAALVNDERLHTGAEFFWETVTQNRSVAFGGNSVSEHFNDPKDFSRMIGHREGPETCNTYNMLRLTKELFKAEPKAAYADFYERALYNHILASINPKRPGYVYFTPIRPAHYRVYSQPEQTFWCCVGTGMENPGRYGEFIYARTKDGVYVNLFIPSELSAPDDAMVLRQETTFPDEERTQLNLQLKKPVTFTLNIRHPAWVSVGDFAIKVNERSVAVESTPSSYAAIRREWKNGDRIEVSLPMRTTVERLGDGSDWVAILHGPIVLACPVGTNNMDGLFADGGRMAHVAHGPMVPLDRVPALLSTEEELPGYIVPDPAAGPLSFRIKDVIEPTEPEGLPLVPFFSLHERRYQMYWELTSRKKIAAKKERLATVKLSSPLTLVPVQAESARNPIIWADVPDPSVIRVGDTYYMSSTTMHMNPGVPIMKSKNLVNWEIVNYAYDILADNDVLALRNGKQAYGRGSWASSLRYHDGTYYVSTFSYSTQRTHVYKTKDIEKGPWTESTFRPPLHDMGLFFKDDGRVFMTYGSGDIKIIELTSDASALKPGGLDQVIIEDASLVAGSNVGLKAEGSHLYKINGKYYIFLITWPKGGMRTELVFRSDYLTGPYEGKVALSDRGIAQGGIIDTPEGKWYAMLFRDYGAVGRIPYLVPVTWEDNWPVFGINGSVPDVLDIMAEPQDIPKIVASDEFDRNAADPALPLQWQWNHNPDNSYWSISERPGYLRLTNGRIDTSILDTQNTLTQRTFGQECSASIAMDIGNMKNGDFAGLAALQKNYGYVGVKMSGNTRSIVMVNAGSGSPVEAANVPLDQERVYLKVYIDYQNRTDKACFYYSLDDIKWQVIGNTLQMSYTLPHFMGYRFALFNYATESDGGFVDFDFFRVDNKLAGPSSASIANIVCNPN